MPSRDQDDRLQSEGKLWELCERIGQSRREGKNRRDGATVRTRVLRLVQLVGKDLFTNAVNDLDEQAPKSHRRRGIQARAQL
jgi:hypothetical protein